MSFACPIHGHYAPTAGTMVSLCPSCAAEPRHSARCPSCNEEWEANVLARALYKAWCEYEIQRQNLAHPLWRGLDADHRTYWIRVAENALTREADREWRS